ncbi:hypothetical protein [Rhodoblastus sp.]|uniref:hypothetical protein n=1 Tax=Rhodoblastus sp. TaxID=1962975 RepID=UPI003F958B79
MTDATTTFAPSAQISVEARRRIVLWLAILGATALCFLLDHSKLVAVWKTGAFFDSDDAMRMVQARDWMAGQSWWDLVAHRLDPPQGMLSHWSRIIDAILAPLIHLFGLFLPAEAAERAARIAFPALSLLALFRAAAYAGRVYLGAAYEIAGVAAVTLSGVSMMQFSPGRIDHHGLQILGLFFASAALAEALDPARARRAAWAGVAIALTAGVGLENLPFFVVLFATPPLAFIVRGDSAKPLLVAFARGLAPALVAVFLATIPPSRWLDPRPDALSIVYLTAFVATAAAFLVLSRLPLERWPARLAASLAAGLAVVALTVFLFPSVLQGPFAGLAPELRDFWLSVVREMQPFLPLLKHKPASGAGWLLGFFFGMAGAGLGVWRAAARADRIERDRWILLGALLLVGAAASAAHVRSFGSAAPLLAIGALGLVAPLCEKLKQKNPAFGGPAAQLVLILAVSRVGLAMLIGSIWAPDSAKAATPLAPGEPTTERCIAPESFAPLARLPAGLAISQLNAGPYLLAHTPHTVLAAPYHRDNHGNLLALHILTDPPEQAEALARSSGARWLFLCVAKDFFFQRYVDWAPDGLAARIAAHRAPSWLKPVALKGTPYLAFEILPAPAGEKPR